MTKTKFTELTVRVIASPVALYQVKELSDRKHVDADVSTVYEHGFVDSDHFRWFVPDGRYWLMQGMPGEHHICSIVVEHPKIEYKKMKEFDLKRWREAEQAARKEDVAEILHVSKRKDNIA
jgi:hypothetical protein